MPKVIQTPGWGHLEEVGTTGRVDTRFPGGGQVEPPPPSTSWNLPATINVAQSGTIGLRQYAVNATGWTIVATGLPAGVTYDAGTESLVGAASGTGTATATFTLSRTNDLDVVATRTVSLYEAGSWQLAHYAEAEYPLEVYYPRPDIETNTWARHRKSHPGVPYHVPVIGAFGAPPWRFELLDGPAGMTVGEFLPFDPSKGIYDWENPGDYGIVRWDNPIATGMPVNGWLVRVRVTDQELVEVIREWRLVVTTEGFLFIDPVNGDNANAGTIASPKRDTLGWCGDGTATTYSGYHCVYRAGTHVTNFLEARHFYGTNRPLVHYGWPGEEVLWDNATHETRWLFQSEGTVRGGMDIYFGDIKHISFPTFDNVKYLFFLTGASQPAYGGLNTGGARMTQFRMEIRNWNGFFSSMDNAGYVFGNNPSPNGERFYQCYSRFGISDSVKVGDATNWGAFAQGSPRWSAFEFFTLVNTNLHFPRPKGGGGYFSVTYLKAIDYLRPIETTSGSTYSGNLTPKGFTEFRYCKASYRVDISDTSAGIFGINSNFADTANYPNHGPENCKRVTAVRARSVRFAMRANSGWPHTLQNSVLVSDRPDPKYASGQPDNYPADPDWARTFHPNDGAVDTNLDLMGEARAAHLGIFGAEIA